MLDRDMCAYLCIQTDCGALPASYPVNQVELEANVDLDINIGNTELRS
jgi:hypothetical protein